MVPTPERRTTTVKADVDGRIPTKVRLSCARGDHRLPAARGRRGLTTPLLVIGVEGDATTPTDHAVALYEAARGPKQLCMQRHTTHYAAYDRYWEATTPQIVAWFDRYLGPADIITPELQSRLPGTGHGGKRMSVDLRVSRRHHATFQAARSRPTCWSTAEKVVGVVDHRHAGRRGHGSVDATGKLVLPGMIDVHVHTREPGLRRTRKTSTPRPLQAAAGGVTTIFGMPNLNPPTNVGADAARGARPLPAEVDRRLQPQPGRRPARGDGRPCPRMGIHAFKVYMVVDTGRTYPHPAGTGMHGHGDLLKMMDIIATTGKRFIIHPHDQSLMDYIEGEYLARGENTPQGYAPAYAARDGVIWDTAIDVVLRLAEASGCPVHLAHMQTARSIDGSPPREGARRRRHLRGEPLGAVPVHLGGRRAARPVRAVVLGPRRGARRRSGRACATGRSTCSPPTTRRTRARRRRSAGPRCGAPTPARPGIQYYYPLAAGRGEQGHSSPSSGSSSCVACGPVRQVRAGRQEGRARRRATTPTSSSRT